MESEQNTQLNEVAQVVQESKPVESTSNETQEAPKTFKEALKEKVAEAETKEAKPQERANNKPKISFEDIGSVAPADMSKEEKEQFSKLDPKAQAYLARISKQYRSDYGRQTQQVKNMEGKIKPIYDIITAEEQELIRMGVRPEDAVKKGLAWEKSFKADPRAAAKELFKTYNIDPIDLIDDEVPEQESNGFNPEAYKAQLKNEIMREFQNQQLEAQQKYAMQNSQDVVNKFMKSKPLFSDPMIGEKLEGEMAAVTSGILQSQPNQDVEAVLEKAYNYVVNGNPEFSTLLQKYNAKAEAEKLNGEAAKARMASRTISGGVSSPVPNQNRGVSFKEAFRRNMGVS